MTDETGRNSPYRSIPLILWISILVLMPAVFSCSSSRGQPSEQAKVSESGDILDVDYRVEKYSAYLDELSEQMMSDYSGTIISEYGQMLTNHRSMTADELTIDSDLFWTTFTGTNYIVPQVISSRVLLLMKEGRLDDAQNTLAFASHVAFTMKSEYEVGYQKYIAGTFDDLERIFQYLDATYYEGVSLSQAGDWEAAVDKFDEVLVDYPHSCPSQNGKAIALLRWGMVDLDVEKLGESHTLMDAAREDDPFYGWAYYNHPDGDYLKPFVIDEVLPTLSVIRNWESIHQVDSELLLNFAADCRIIDAPEYSLFALMAVIQKAFFQYVEEGHVVGFDIDHVSKESASILGSMGMTISAEACQVVFRRFFD